MAEALKTFREGEDILASDTNDNNQFLLSKLSDNAAQVQQYVEGEVATIKSNVSSVQATLQNNIDNLKTEFNMTLETIFEAIAPNYAAGYSIKSGFEAPEYGQCVVQFKGAGTAYVDGCVVAWHGGAINYQQASGSAFLVPKGSKVTATNYSTLNFYPCKGFEVEAE